MKVVALLSGGIDSSTLLYYLKMHTNDIEALTFDYGQKHRVEIEAASRIAERCQVKHTIINISGIGPLLRSALTSEDIDVPSVEMDAERYETLAVTAVPNRNAILLCIGVAYAVSIGYDTVAYAAHASERGVYPDCTPEFVRVFEQMIRIAIEKPNFTIFAPFVNMHKYEIVHLGSRLGVPFEITVSCYKGIHCGECSSCVERKRAFKLASIPDPTRYIR